MLNLNKDIKVDFFTKKNSPTILKKRFLVNVNPFFINLFEKLGFISLLIKNFGIS